MATTMNSVLLEQSGVREAIIGAAFRSCPELLSSLYTSHYRYVLRVCRHFFWRREDAEDAAAEVLAIEGHGPALYRQAAPGKGRAAAAR